MKLLNFDLATWEVHASNKNLWCKTSFVKLKGFEDIRLKHRDQIRKALKTRLHQKSSFNKFHLSVSVCKPQQGQAIIALKKVQIKYVFPLPKCHW